MVFNETLTQEDHFLPGCFRESCLKDWECEKLTRLIRLTRLALKCQLEATNQLSSREHYFLTPSVNVFMQPNQILPHSWYKMTLVKALSAVSERKLFAIKFKLQYTFKQNNVNDLQHKNIVSKQLQPTVYLYQVCLCWVQHILACQFRPRWEFCILYIYK